MSTFRHGGLKPPSPGSALARVQAALVAAGAVQRSTTEWSCFQKDNHAHDDKSGSLTARYGDKKKNAIMLACAKCGGIDNLLPGLGLTRADLVDTPEQVTRHYVYCDEAGQPLFRVVKRPGTDGGKSRPFQQRADGHGGWINGVQGVPRVLYRLDELLRAISEGKTIHLTEGESDADALNAHFFRTSTHAWATCHPGGAGRWLPDHTATLIGAARVVVWADRDGPGYACAHLRLSAVRAAGLKASARQPAKGKDVRDHLVAGLGPEAGEKLKPKHLAVLAKTAAQESKAATPGDESDGELADDGQVQQRVGVLWVNERAKRQFQTELMAERNSRSRGSRQMDGAEFVLDLPPDAPVLWGAGNEQLWVDGEALLLAGGDGVGKTTIAQQLAFRRLGVKSVLLDYPVQPAAGRVLYLAMDRPDQARRSFARMLPSPFGEERRSMLKERLAIWRGPVPVDVLAGSDVLADWVHDTFGSDVSDVFVDSYKDLAPGLSDDAVGAGLNSAMQEVLARGMNWLGIHHQRKANGSNPDPTELADVYGSRWLTAGVGSLLMLVGRAGDRTVEVRHLKQPAFRVGPLLVQHDHVNGTTQRADNTREPLDVLDKAGADGITAYDGARELYGSVEDAAKKKATRVFTALTNRGEAVKRNAKNGGAGGSQPARFWLKKHAPAGL